MTTEPVARSENAPHPLAPLLDAGLRVGMPEVTSDQRRMLLAYVGLLAKWNKTFNLTAVRDPAQMIGLHLLDSLSVLPTLRRLKLNAICDVGSGAGLPGLPLAICNPDLRVTMIDCIEKKTSFIQQCVAELRLTNAVVVTARVEAMQAPNAYPAIISRAYAELAGFVSSVRPLTDQTSLLLAMKGAHPHDEIARLPSDIEVQEVIALSVPGVDAARHLVVMKRVFA